MSNQTLLEVLFFVFGAIWGSFSNVIIVRLPKDESIISPRSHCPQCKKTIPWFHNIPIVSWIFLRGKCAFCEKRISVRYPIVEIIMGLSFLYLFKAYGLSFSFFEYSVFAFGVITASFIDIDHMILPDRFTLSGIVIGLVGALINPERMFMDALIGVLIGGGFLYAIAYAYFIIRKVDGMGGGDIKLLGWIGAICGWQSIPFVVFASSMLGLLFGIFYMIRSQEGLKTGLPFGPYLSLAALLYLMFDLESVMNLFIPM